MVRVFVFTDEPILVAGLRSVFGSDSDMDLCGFCDEILKIPVEIRLHKPDILVLQVGPDVNVPLLDSLRHEFPECRIVLWARELSLSLAAQAVNLGVAGILRRSMPLSLVEKCIRRVSAGEKWFEKDLILQLLSAKTVTLTRRERQLVRLLSQGLSNKEIGNVLDLKESTVKVYLSKLYRKAGVTDRLELALIGLRNLGLEQLKGEGGAVDLPSIVVQPLAREQKWPQSKAG